MCYVRAKIIVEFNVVYPESWSMEKPSLLAGGQPRTSSGADPPLVECPGDPLPLRPPVRTPVVGGTIARLRGHLVARLRSLQRPKLGRGSVRAAGSLQAGLFGLGPDIRRERRRRAFRQEIAGGGSPEQRPPERPHRMIGLGDRAFHGLLGHVFDRKYTSTAIRVLIESSPAASKVNWRLPGPFLMRV